jgi:response regulator RpfG family c-di-GMP phosphodiesterase
MTERVLFVDSDPGALESYARSLGHEFDVFFAASGEEGLEVIIRQGPFAVIASDLRLSGMGGVTFLTRARACAPNSVLMMLTAHTDLQTAFDAVNEGIYYRFLIKPCRPEQLIKALKAGVTQYHLLIAERELLEKTLTNSVEVMTEILGMVSPLAYGRAARVRSFVRDIATQMHLPNAWQIEVAAMLSQIGCMAMSTELLTKAYSGAKLTDDEHELFDAHPSIGSALVASIPRMETVAHMIENQRLPFKLYAADITDPDERDAALGAQILKVAIDLDQAVAGGMAPVDALARLRARPGDYNSAVVTALAEAKGATASFFAPGPA